MYFYPSFIAALQNTHFDLNVAEGCSNGDQHHAAGSYSSGRIVFLLFQILKAVCDLFVLYDDEVLCEL